MAIDQQGIGLAPRSSGRLGDLAAVVLALATGVVLALIVTLVIPVMPAVSAHFGGGTLGKLFAQYFVAISAVGVIIGAPVAGFFVDRGGLKPALIVSALLCALAGMVGAGLESAVALLVSRFAVGLGAGGFAAAATALIGRRWTGDKRAQILGLVSVLGGAGSVVTVLIAGAIGHAFGWRAPFLLYGILGALALLAFAIRDERAPPAQFEPQTSGALKDWRPLFPIFLTALPLYIALFCALTQLPLLLGDLGMGDPGKRSLLLATSPVFSGLSAFLFAPLRRRLKSDGMFLLIICLYALGLVTMGLVNGPIMVVVTSALCGAGTGLLPTYFTNEILNTAPEAIQGRAVAANVAVQYAAQFLNPVVIGTLGAVIGMRPALLAAGVILASWAILAAPFKLLRSREKAA